MAFHYGLFTMAIINLMDRLSEGKTRGIQPPKKMTTTSLQKEIEEDHKKKPMFEVFLAQKNDPLPHIGERPLHRNHRSRWITI